MPLISGMIVPIVTPLTPDQEVEGSALRRLCDAQVSAGIDGVFVLGTTGEFYGLTREQRRLVVETAVETIAGRIPVLPVSAATALPLPWTRWRSPGIMGFQAMWQARHTSSATPRTNSSTTSVRLQKLRDNLWCSTTTPAGTATL